MYSIKILDNYKVHVIGLARLFKTLLDFYVSHTNYSSLILLNRFLFELRKGDLINQDEYLRCHRTVTNLMLAIKPPKPRKAQVVNFPKVEPFTHSEYLIFIELKRRKAQVECFIESGVQDRYIKSYLHKREKAFPIRKRIGLLAETEEYKYLYGTEPKQAYLWELLD